MELRDIETFLTLAEELHFGRTAERLYVSQARVSQAIKKQERYIGAALFDRTSQAVSLAELGRQLRDDLKPLCAGLHESLGRARKAAALGPTTTLRIGMMPFNVADLHHYWREFRKRYPQCTLEIRMMRLTESFSQLRNGEMDVFVGWLPIEEPDFTVGPVLCTDARIMAVAADHKLARKSSVPLETFSDFPHVTAQIQQEYWKDGYLPFNTPRGRQIERSQLVNTADELINTVGMGRRSTSSPAMPSGTGACPTSAGFP